jgi:hypothetical protein
MGDDAVAGAGAPPEVRCVHSICFVCCVFILLPAFHLFLRFSSLVVRIPQQPTPPPRDIMGYLKRFAQEAANLTEKLYKKARLLESRESRTHPHRAW